MIRTRKGKKVSLLRLVDADNNDDDAETERKTIEMTMEDIKTTPTRVQQKEATVLPQTKTIILE